MFNVQYQYSILILPPGCSRELVMVGSISKSKNKTKQRTKVSCCGNSLKLAVSFEFKNRVSRTRLNETCLNPPLHWNEE